MIWPLQVASHAYTKLIVPDMTLTVRPPCLYEDYNLQTRLISPHKQTLMLVAGLYILKIMEFSLYTHIILTWAYIGHQPLQTRVSHYKRCALFVMSAFLTKTSSALPLVPSGKITLSIAIWPCSTRVYASHCSTEG